MFEDQSPFGGGMAKKFAFGAEPRLAEPNTGERQRARQRRLPKGIFIIPEDEAPEYTPPESYPEDAKEYLRWLARTGTMSGAVRMACLDTRKPYGWREHLEGFEEEEQCAKDCVTDWIESRSFQDVAHETGMPGVSMRQFMLKKRRRKEYGDKQEIDVKGEVGLTWVDIMKRATEENGGE